MSACQCLTQRPLPHEGHCCLKDGWNPAADQLPDMHPDLSVCSHADEWAVLHQSGGE
jgi:hypothetical protein